MSEQSEKSCWGVTLWAVVVVVSMMIVTTLFQSPEQAATLGQSLV